MQAIFLMDAHMFSTDEQRDAGFKYFTDAFAKAGIISAYGVTTGKTDDEIVEMLQGAQIIMCAGNPPISRYTIEHCPDIKIIQRMGIGVDSIDAVAATERGIPVMNVAGYCVEELAVHAAGMILGNLRHLPSYDREIRTGGWGKGTGVNPLRVSNLTMGICGLGGSGRISARIWGKGFQCRVIAYDPYVTQKSADEVEATLVDFETLCRESDLITIHAPLTEETYHMFSFKEFAMMKRNMIIANTARGPIIDQEALVDALKTKKIAAAGLDVFEEEPMTANNPLRGFEDCTVFTPHSAYQGLEAAQFSFELSVTLPVLAIKDKKIYQHYVTNKEVLPALEQQYFVLDGKLG